MCIDPHGISHAMPCPSIPMHRASDAQQISSIKTNKPIPHAPFPISSPIIPYYTAHSPLADGGNLIFNYALYAGQPMSFRFLWETPGLAPPDPRRRRCESSDKSSFVPCLQAPKRGTTRWLISKLSQPRLRDLEALRSRQATNEGSLSAYVCFCCFSWSCSVLLQRRRWPYVPCDAMPCRLTRTEPDARHDHHGRL